VLICRDSIALGAGLESLFRFLKEDRLNLVDSWPRDKDLSLPALTGGGAKWGFADGLVELEGIVIEAGRL
jgi:hypothetical protein